MLRLLGPVTLLIGLVVPVSVAQAACSVPNTLSNGTTADATPVMGNFTSIAGCAAPLASPSFTGTVGIGATAVTTLDTAGGMMRAQGGASYGTVPSSGKGLEIGYDTSTDTARILAYQRPSTGYKTFQLDGSTLSLNGNSSGNVGIGTTSPTSTLHIYGSSSPSISLVQNPGVAGGTSISLNAAGGGGNNAVVYLHSFAIWGRTSGDGFIGSTSLTPWVQFASTGTTFTGSGGTCTINGSGSCTSDARLKTRIHEIAGADALNRLSKISGVTYNWVDPGLEQKQNVGVLAQSVLQAYPQLVGTTDLNFRGKKGKYYTVNYAGLTAPLISAVNELNRRVSVLQDSVREVGRERVVDVASAPVRPSKPDMAQLTGLIESLQIANERQAAEIRALKNEIGEVRRSVRLQTALNTGAGSR